MIRSFSVLLGVLVVTQASAQHPVIQGIVDGVSADSLMWHLHRLDGELPINIGNGPQSITSRHKLNAGNALASDWLQIQLDSLGYAPYVQTFSGTTGENVYGVKLGMTHPGRKVVVCGHYDAMPGGPVAAPAADDDGSGTCAVLEAARLFAPHAFENTVVFAFWDEEEQGLLGSEYFAGVAAASDDTLIAVINMDAISYDGDGDGLMRVHTKSTANSIAIKDTAVLVNSLYGINQPMAINNPGASYSDHASFWNEGYGAILVIEDFDNDGNPHYHTPTDLTQYLDVPYYVKLTQIGLATTAAWAVPYEMGTAVDELPAGDEAILHVYPNPASAQAQVWVKDGAIASLRVHDATGRVVLKMDPQADRAVLDLGPLPEGAYVIHVQMVDGRANSTRLLHMR